jgi:DNA polymerase, archaea type
MSITVKAISQGHISHRNELLDDVYAAIDIEYRVNENESNNLKPYTIFAVAIVDSLDNVKVKHESDFTDCQYPEKELVQWAMSEILKYRLTIGWYSKGVRLQKEDGTFSGKDSDLKIIDQACQYYNIPSIIGFDIRGVPYLRGYDYRPYNIDPYYSNLNKFDWYYHIDLYQVYKKPMIKTIIYQNKYKDLNLDSAAKAILNEGKFENLDGLQIQNLSKQKQIEYVAQDSTLVMKLSKHNNCEILDLMNAISIITNVPFDKVCHTGISTWWNNIISDRLNNSECRPPNAKIEKRKYAGGEVIAPIVGDYKHEAVYVLDVKSLYPSMMINNNISFDTVNCDCCKNNPDAKVSKEIMDLINKDLQDDHKRKSYWICKDPNYKGIIPRLLTQYREERFRQQELGNNPMQLALKNLINGVYGLFGSKFFEFSDYRVAELTTAFGRQTLGYMQHIAKEV